MPSVTSRPTGATPTNPGVSASRVPFGQHHYLERVIARGSTGRIYLAHSVDFAERFAIKVLTSTSDHDPKPIVRSAREHSAGLQINHPNVLAVREIVEHEGRVGLVMDLIEGGDLSQRLLAKPPRPVETVDIVADLAAGLSAIHTAGIVHRDLKPSNILLDTASGSVVPKIADFGVATLLDGPEPPTTTVGTPMYISPEAIRGQQSRTESDVYSLGVILFEMLADRPPFKAPTAVEVMGLHLSEPSPQLVGAPPELADLVDRMLQKQPRSRPSLTEVESVLRAVRAQVADRPSAFLTTGPTPKENQGSVRLEATPTPSDRPASATPDPQVGGQSILAGSSRRRRRRRSRPRRYWLGGVAVLAAAMAAGGWFLVDSGTIDFGGLFDDPGESDQVTDPNSANQNGDADVVEPDPVPLAGSEPDEVPSSGEPAVLQVDAEPEPTTGSDEPPPSSSTSSTVTTGESTVPERSTETSPSTTQGSEPSSSSSSSAPEVTLADDGSEPESSSSTTSAEDPPDDSADGPPITNGPITQTTSDDAGSSG